MKHLFRRTGAAILSMVCVLFSSVSNMPVKAEAAPIEITISGDELRSVTNYTNATNDIKGIIVTTAGMAAFGCGGSPGSEPRPQLSVFHTSDSKEINTLKFKTLLGDFTRIEIHAGSVTVGVDASYQTPEGWSYGSDWAVWEGKTPELILDGADLYPGIIADPIQSITFTIQPGVEDSMMDASGKISPFLSAIILVSLAAVAGTIYFRSKKSQSPEKP